MKDHYGVKVRTNGMRRSLWLSPKPREATRLRVHASSWKTREEAQAVVDAMTADPRNAHLILKVERFT